jgi:hypothetical protein
MVNVKFVEFNTEYDVEADDEVEALIQASDRINKVKFFFFVASLAVYTSVMFYTINYISKLGS